MKKRMMLLIALLLSVVFSGCSMSYHGDTLEKDDVLYYYADRGKKAFASTFYYDGTNPVVEIPDEVQGYKVTRLGGYFGRGVPVPYTSEILESALDAMDLNTLAPFDEGEVMIYVDLTLKIGANIEDINALDTWTVFDRDGITYNAIPIVYIECAEENRHFYSKDGRLYDKDDDTLVEGFIYERYEESEADTAMES